MAAVLKLQLPRIEPDQLGDDFDSWRKGLVFPVQKLIEQVGILALNGISFADNMFCSTISIQGVQHGIETAFIPPTRMKKPLGIILLDATDANGNDVQIASHSRLNFARQDAGQGFIGITVQYAPPLGGYQTAFGAASANTNTVWRSVASAVLPPGDWDIVGQVEFGGAPTGTVNCTAALTLTAPPASPSPGTFGDNLLQTGAPTSAADASLTIVGYRQQLSSATTVYLASLGNFTGGTLQSRGKISARCVAPDPATTATVRAILVGA